MEKKDIKPEEKTDQTELFEVKGKKFDISTEQGKRDLKLFTEGLFTSHGDLTNEVGQLRKQNSELEEKVKPLKSQYTASTQTIDELYAKATKAREAGDDVAYDEAFRQIFNTQNATIQNMEARLVEDEFWGRYVSRRKEMFDVLDPEVYRNYIFSQYADEIRDSDNPYALLDSVLQPKAAKFTKPEPEDPEAGYASQGKGHGARMSERDNEKKESEDKSSDSESPVTPHKDHPEAGLQIDQVNELLQSDEYNSL